jgi:hypothetical protein
MRDENQQIALPVRKLAEEIFFCHEYSPWLAPESDRTRQGCVLDSEAQGS